jgi:hypothetical protein
MAKTKMEPALTQNARRASGTWPVALAATAAAGQTDGGERLYHLLEEAGFAKKPEMTVIVKRPRPARSERGRIIDPYVDDVLDALRALCA